MQGRFLRPDEGISLPSIGVLKATAEQTGGSFELIEYRGPAAPPPHVHREREELFSILEGNFRFVLGEEQFEAGPGATILVPRGTRHGFTPSEGSRALLFISPAGLQGFFEELGAGLAEGRQGSEIRADLEGKYDSFAG